MLSDVKLIAWPEQPSVTAGFYQSTSLRRALFVLYIHAPLNPHAHGMTPYSFTSPCYDNKTTRMFSLFGQIPSICIWKNSNVHFWTIVWSPDSSQINFWILVWAHGRYRCARCGWVDWVQRKTTTLVWSQGLSNARDKIGKWNENKRQTRKHNHDTFCSWIPYLISVVRK